MLETQTRPKVETALTVYCVGTEVIFAPELPEPSLYPLLRPSYPTRIIARTLAPRFRGCDTAFKLSRNTNSGMPAMQSLLPLDGNTSSPQRDAHAAQAAHAASPDNSARVPRGAGTPPDATTVANRPRGPRKRDRGEVSRADVAYPRKRATAACRLCRSRKVKCNNARPTCGNCSSHNAVCVYEDSDDVSA